MPRGSATFLSSPSSALRLGTPVSVQHGLPVPLPEILGHKTQQYFYCSTLFRTGFFWDALCSYSVGTFLESWCLKMVLGILGFVLVEEIGCQDNFSLKLHCYYLGLEMIYKLGCFATEGAIMLVVSCCPIWIMLLG